VKRPLTTPSCRRALLLALAAAASIAAALFLGGAAPANATPPGSNGLISYRVYFNADHTEGALFVANPDGSNSTQITFPGAGNLDTNQNWSPSGQQLVYEHDTADGSSSIWTVGALGANPQEIVPCPGPGVLVNCAGVSNPSWSPNGQWIAFELVLGPFDPSGNPADDSIWAVRPNGSGLRQITHRTPSGASSDQNPQWSPDSSRIAFQRNDAPHFNAEVWTANSTTGGDLVRVSPPGIRGGDHPDYSPDGRWIMFRTDNDVPGSAKLMIAHPDGTGLRILLDGANNRRFFSSSFSPDGTGFTVGIAPGVGPDGNADIFVGHFDSHERVSSLTNITHSDIWESSPRWGTHALLP
jgi:Tol biopolymer transport system component